MFVCLINTLLGNIHLEDVTQECLSVGFNKYENIKNHVFYIHCRTARIANFCNMNTQHLTFACKSKSCVMYCTRYTHFVTENISLSDLADINAKP